MTATPDKVRPWGPLALSALLHAGLALAGAALVTVLPAPPAHVQHRDAWAGNTFQIDGLVTERGGPAKASSPAAQPARAAKAAPAKPAATAPPSKAAALTARAGATAAPAAPAKRPRPAASARAVGSARAAASVSAAASARAPAPSSHAPPAAAPDLSHAMAAAADGSAPERGGRFGAAGVLPGVRDLAKAFTRALPRAASGDPLWSKLPLGSAGGFHVVIRIDEQRRIESVKPDEKSLSPALQHLLDRTVLMLKAGQFALDRNDVTSGNEKLHVELAISMRARSNQIDVDPTDTVELGFKPPTRDKPGRGYFTLASGRHVEASVTIEKAP